MTDTEAMRAILAKATPGEWWVCEDDSGDRPVTVPSIQAPTDLDCAVVHWDGFWQTHWQSARGLKEMGANAAAIVALRNAATAMLDEIDALRAENARLREALVKLRDCDWVISLPDRMDAVRDIARAALTQAASHE
jgi:hypothetical protein